MFLVGQVMKTLQKKVDVTQVKEILLKKLKEIS